MKQNKELKNIITQAKKKYDYVSDFHYNFAIISLNNKYGIINNQGTEIVKPSYNLIFNFNHNNLARAILNNTYGYINTNGEFIPDKPKNHKPKQSNTLF